MRGKLLTIPTTDCPREPSCSVVFSHSTDDAEPPLNKTYETEQILNYANFEIATALMYPAHFRRIITAPVHGRTSNTSFVHCGRSAVSDVSPCLRCAATYTSAMIQEPHCRKVLQVALEQALADPCTPQSLHPVARQAISMPSADPTFHRMLDMPVGVSTLMPRDRCGWSEATDLCNDVVSADTLLVHMRKHVGGSSHRRVYCSWNGCGKLMRRDCLIRHIREIHLHSKRRAHD